MASFDPKKLLKATGLNPKDKLLSTLNSRASNLTSRLTGDVAARLAQAGQSLQSATAFAAAKTDALLSSAPQAFSSMAALGGGVPAIERISRSDLVSFRGGGEIRFDPQSVIPESQEDGQYTDTTRYPADLPEDYHMRLDFMEYERPNLSEPPKGDMRFSISLPIPQTLVERYGVQYSEGQYGATLGNVINAIDNPNNAQLSLAGTIGAARGVGQSAIAQMGGQIAGGFGVDGQGLEGLVDQTLGSIVNPHLALFFKGPELRTHEFSWNFAPRNAQDSKHLKEIYYRIKRASLPALTVDASDTTLDYPMMVKVRIYTKDGKELYPFKMCVIAFTSMNYASSGVPAFHADGAPVLQQLSMTLREIEYFTSNSIGETQGSDYPDVGEELFASEALNANTMVQLTALGANLAAIGTNLTVSANSVVTQLGSWLGAPTAANTP